MTDYRDLNENAAPTNPLITNSEGLPSQVMMTNKGAMIATDIETNTEQIKPCISEDQLYLSNKTFLIFFFPKIYQHFICSLLLFFQFKIELLLGPSSVNLPIALGSVAFIILCIGVAILKGFFYNKSNIPKILLFFIHFFVSNALNLGILAGSLYLNDDYKLYIPFFHISVICLILTIALFFTTNKSYLVLNVILGFGIISSFFWFFLVGKMSMAFVFGIVAVFFGYYMFFSWRTVKIMKKDSDTSVILYNTIFYSATMSIYCFFFAIFVAALVVCLAFLLCLAAGGGGAGAGAGNPSGNNNTNNSNEQQNNQNNQNRPEKNEYDCDNCLLCTKHKYNREIRNFNQ